MSSTPPNNVLALIDCDSFYCSCERLFHPKAKKKPVVVLSNNDGCVVSRTKEVKALGIPMGVPYFKIKQLCREHGILAFSSNYPLYADMSSRVMRTLYEFTPEVEVYSIDEAFLNLTTLPVKNFLDFGIEIKSTVIKEVGIPVSVGIASTKVLTKVATSLAKKNREGVFVIDDQTDMQALLSSMKVEDIWGIGRQSALKLHILGIRNAWQLRNAEPALIQKTLTVVGKRIQLELQGVPCIDLELEKEHKQQILSSKSFFHSVWSKKELQEALANHAVRASEKLRAENQVCFGLQIFIHTNRFKDLAQYYNSATEYFLSGTHSPQDLITKAFSALDKIYRDGFEYKKCGIMLFDLRPHTELQLSLFDHNQKEHEKKEAVNQTLDKINQKFGSHTISFLACGTRTPWDKNGTQKSPSYTTSWKELPKVN